MINLPAKVNYTCYYESRSNQPNKMVPIPKVRLNSGYDMPIFGLGTCQSLPGEVTKAVENAIAIGYRHFDCALIYRNEAEIGNTLKEQFEAGTIKREELFITSKLWCTYHQQDQVVPSLQKTLHDLRLDYIDLYLIHWPMGFKEGNDLSPQDADGNTIFSEVDYLETWKGMEEAVRLGLTKSIGLSNFNSLQIERVLEAAAIPPAVNQFEVSPYLVNAKLVDFCQQKGIAVTGFSPLGSPDVLAGKPRLLDNEKLMELGKKHNKSTAQVVLRWAVQRNIITIPKSVQKKRLQENIDIFNFTLSEEDMACISNLDCDGRTGLEKRCVTHKYYPFQVEF